MAFASDTFSTGTPGAALAAPWVRNSSSNGSIVFSDAQRCRGSASGFCAHLYSASPASADYSVSATLYRAGTETNTMSCVAARMVSGSTTLYYAGYDGNANVILGKLVSGSQTALASVASTFAQGTTRQVRLECIGTALKVYVDGNPTAIISVTDASISAAGFPGLRTGAFGSTAPTNSTCIHIDDFSAEEPVTGISLMAAPSTGAGESQVAAIAQDHALAGLAVVQDTASPAAAIDLGRALAVDGCSATSSAAAVSIMQAHALSGAATVQAAISAAAIIDQGGALLAAAAVQPNASAAGVITQTHAVAIAGALQASEGDNGAIIQAHALAASSAAQATLSSAMSIILGAAFPGEACTSTGASEAVGITQQHALTAAASDQVAIATTPAIEQGHALAAASADQALISRTIAITLGDVHHLGAAPGAQPAVSQSAAIMQSHVLVHAPSVQDSIAAASPIVQTYALMGGDCDQVIACSAGEIGQETGIPPVHGPRGAGPILRIPFGHRPGMDYPSRRTAGYPARPAQTR